MADHIQETGLEGERFACSPRQRHLISLGLHRCWSSILLSWPEIPDETRLRSAFEELTDHYEILRTRIDLSGSSPRQLIRETADIRIEKEVTDPPDDLMEGVDILIQWKDTRVRLCLPAHMVDDHSLIVLAQLWHGLYTGTAELDPEVEQYADSAAMFDEMLSDEESSGERAFWESYPKGCDRAVSLPLSHDTEASGQVAQLSFPIEAKGLPAEPRLFLLACWQLLTRRLMPEDPPVLAAAWSGRPYEELEDAPGLYAQYLPMPEVDLSAPFGTLLERLTELDEEFTDLQHFLERPAGAGFSLGFSVVDSSLAAHLKPRELCVRAEPFQLALCCQLSPAGIEAVFHYNPEQFPRTEIERLAARFAELLNSALRAPELACGKLNILPQAERQLELATFNDSDAAEPPHPTVPDLIDAVIARQGAREALCDGVSSLTYDELGRRIDALAGQLLANGLVAGESVAVALSTYESALALLAITRAGGVFLPLGTHLPAERMSFQLRECGARLLLTRDPSLATALPEVTTLIPKYDGLTSDRLARPTPEMQAYTIFTSGSTGRPKGVVLGHRGLANSIWGQVTIFELEPGQRVLQAASPVFDLFVSEVLTPLVAGACLVVVPDSIRTSSADLSRFIQAQRVDLAFLTPSMIATLDPHLPFPRRLMSGGEAMTIGILHDWSKDRVLINGYGPTEVTIAACYKRLEPTDDDLPMGLHVPNQHLLVLDPHLEQVPLGMSGELCCSGVDLAMGYLSRPSLTAEKFVPNPYADRPDHDRLYRTGDLVRRREDGQLIFMGRIDHQVKLRGFRIELGEIEAQLSSLEGIKQAVVVLHSADGFPRLVAYLRAGDLDIDQARAHLAERLPDYMVPTHFIVRDRMPHLPSGKVDRKALAALPLDSREIVAPRSRLEAQLLGLFEDVLDRRPLSVYDNFFELGGHSLTATVFSHRIRDELGLAFEVTDLFAVPRVADLATHLSDADGTQAEQIPALPRDSFPARFPLSFAQQRLWFIDRFLPNNAGYNIAVGLRLRGALSITALEEALDALIERHEILRTTYGVDEAFQLVHPKHRRPLPIIDVSDDSSAVLTIQDRDAGTPFDLHEGGVFRASLLREAAETHVLLLCCHHIATDGWSMEIMGRELMALYADFVAGRPPSLQPLPIQYADFASWQRARESDSSLEWWLDDLTDLPELQLPLDAPRPKQQSFNGATVRGFIEGRETLDALTRQQSCTPFNVLLAASFAWLYRYSGQQDFALGSTFANRGGPPLGDLIGFFVNTLPVRLDFDRHMSFAGLVRAVGQKILAIQAHQEQPFEQLVDALQVVRDPAKTPLYQVVFNYNQQQPTASISGMAPEPLPERNRHAKFDLTIQAGVTDEGISLALQFNTDIFLEASARALLDHLCRLLEAGLGNPNTPIYRLPMLSGEERARLLDPGNAVAKPTALIHELVRAQAERHPSRIALTCDGVSLSYAELEERANRLAHFLRNHGIGPEARVGLVLNRSNDLVVAILAVLEAGGLYVPIDPNYPEARREFITRDAGLSLLLHDGSAEDDALAFPLNALDLSIYDSSPPITACLPENGAYIIYTSGSTGQPKGVLIPHDRVTRLFSATDAWFGFNERDIWSLFHSYAFDFSVWEIWGALFHGGRLVVVPYFTSRDPLAFFELLCREGVTVLNQSPSAFKLLLNLDVPAELEPRLRYVIFGAEALNIAALRPWFDRHGFETPTLVNMYGITETTVHVTWRPVAEPDCGRARSPLGVPIPDLRIYLLDRDLMPVPVGAPGEICVGGAGLARGYLARPGLSAERFVPDPFSKQPGRRLYRSGDLGRFDRDGELAYLGRLDHQVKVKGFRIEVGEIQAVLTNHPRVVQCAVVVRPDDRGQNRLIAYLIPTDQTLSLDAVRAFLLERLPEYMVPAAFVPLEAFPLTAHGKLDYRNLPDPEPMDSGVYVAPVNELERMLVGVWAHALGLDRVSVTDNFFALGGDSIRSIEVLGQARKHGLVFSLQELFAHQSVRDLAALIAQRDHSSASSATSVPFQLVPVEWSFPEDVVDAYPMSRMQLGMIYHMELEPELMPYHNVTTFLLEGPIEEAAFREAVRRVMMRHPIFRTSLHLSDHEVPLQWVHRQVTPALVWQDISQLDEEAQRDYVRGYMASQRQTPFELTSPGQWRLAVFLGGPERFRLSVTENHAILDGWSYHSALAEIMTLMERLQRGEAVPQQPTPSVSYRDFIALEQEALASRETREFWQARMRNWQVMVLPEGEPEPPPERDVWRETHAFDRDQTQLLEQLGREAGAPLKSVLVAAHARFLSLITGEEKVTTGIQVNGRPEWEGGQEVLGLFLNTMPLHLTVGEGSWLELVRQVFTHEWEALPHRRYPFAELQEQAGDTELFEAFFNFINFHVVEDLFEKGGLRVIGDLEAQEPNNFPLMINFSLQPVTNELTLVFQSSSPKFGPRRLHQFAEWMVAILEEMMAAGVDPERAEQAHHLFSPIREESIAHTDAGDLAVRDRWGMPLPVGAVGYVWLRGDGWKRTERRGRLIPCDEGFRLEEVLTEAVEAAPAEVETPTHFVAPKSETEGALAQLWSEVLGVSPIGRQHHFFKSGGHSLSATRVTARIRDHFGVNLPLRVIFDAPVLSDLADRVDGASGESELPVIAPRPSGATVPLSFSQQRLWFLFGLEGPSATYNMPITLEITGPLQVSLLERVLAEMTARHEVLRTVIRVEVDRPEQVVLPIKPFQLNCADVAGWDNASDGLAEAVAAHIFAPDEAPPWRVLLVRLGHESHLLCLNLHHIISDGWSMGVIANELSSLYRTNESRPTFTTDALPALPLQYGDYALWQRRFLSSRLENHLTWWRDALDDLPELLELPYDRPRPAVQSFAGQRLFVSLDASSSHALMRFATERGTTIFTTLLAGFGVLLGRYAQSDDVALGTPVAGRDQTGLEGLIGFFVNTLVTRVRLSDNPSFGEMLSNLHAYMLEALERQVPFERLVEQLDVQRSLSYSPLFQVMFAWQNAPFEESDSGHLTLRPRSTEATSARFDLTLNLRDSSAGIGGELEFNSDLFDGDSMQRLWHHFSVLLKQIVADPGRPVLTIPLLDEADRTAQLDVLNNTPPLPGTPIHVRARALADRDRDAPVFLDGDDGHMVYTRHQLQLQAAAVSSWLRERGVGVGDVVGLLADPGPHSAVAILATLTIGAAWLPMDPAYPLDRLRFMLADTGASALLSRVPIARALFEGPLLDLNATLPQADPPDLIEPPASLPAYVMFTSGSTGRPKGVVCSHGNLANVVTWTSHARGIGGDDRLGLTAAAAFDAGVWEFACGLALGPQMIALPRQLAADPRGFQQWILQHRVTTCFAATPVAELMWDLPWPEDSPLRLMQIGGEKVKRHPTADLPFRVEDNYGPAECTVIATATVVRDAASGPLHIGGPIAGVRVFVVDRFLEPVPVGMPGELVIAGEGVSQGYAGRGALTASRFVPNPFAAHFETPGSRIYRTGDLVCRRADGFLTFLGRIDTQVALRGLRIELGEIEATLLSLDGVVEVVVLLLEEGGGSLVAFAAGGNESLDPDRLHDHARERLPAYMVPARFVCLDHLPQTANGKVDRRALADRAHILSQESSSERPVPKGPIAVLLAQIWAEVLGLEVAEIFADDQFFLLGGHSLLAHQVVVRVERRMVFSLPLRAVFAYPVLSDLATHIDHLRQHPEGEAPVPLEAQPRPDDAHGWYFPLSFAQTRLWFLDRLPGTGTAYSIPLGLRLRGPLAAAALEGAFVDLIARHESLRTRFFHQRGEDPLMWVLPELAFSLGVIDLCHAHGEGIARLAATEAALPFDLAAGPLLRARLLRLDETEHVLLVNLHHIIADGWSVNVLVSDLAMLLRLRLGLSSAKLEPLAVQYADVAVWQRERLQGKELTHLLSFWKHHLEGAPDLLQLPTDHPRPALQSFRGALFHFSLSPASSRDIYQLCDRLGVTPFMFLLGAWSILLSRYANQRDVVIGTPSAGRLHASSEPLIGCFVNTLVLRLDTGGNPTVRDFVARVRQLALDAYSHEALPFERLVEELGIARDLSYPPVFQVMFALQNLGGGEVNLPGLSAEPLEAAGVSAKFDLNLVMSGDRHGLGGDLEFNVDLFDEATAAGMIQGFRHLLQGFCEFPGRPIDQISLHDSGPLDLGAGPLVARPFRSLAARFEQAVADSADAVAVVGGGDSFVSYGALNRCANRLAHHLRHLGVGPDVPVAVSMNRSPALIAALLAVLKAGGAYVPVDPAYPPARRETILRSARPAVVLCDVGASIEADGCVVEVSLPYDSSWSDANPSHVRLPEHLAYILFTSGSTGVPKGVAIPDSAAGELVDWAHETFEPDLFEGLLAATSINFDLSVFEIFATLCAGGKLVLVRDVLALAESAPAVDIALINTVPSAIDELVRLDALPESVRVVNLAGEALNRDTVTALYQTGHVRDVYNLYGPSEDTTYSTFARVDSREERPPIGKPISNTWALVLDAAGATQPEGVPGQLFLAGAGLARGYYGDPLRTAASFVPHPFAGQHGIPEGARCYCTGDLVMRRADGNLMFLGRVDHQVKLRGFRIELGEIEAVLRNHENVVEAAVLVLSAEEAEPMLVAFVQADTDADSLQVHVATSLPGYMVPTRFEFLERLPHLPNGKLDRKALANHKLSITSDALADSHDEGLTTMLGLWERLLGRPVAAHDNFFGIGGHSLMAARMVGEIQTLFGVELELTDLFRFSTPAALLVRVRAGNVSQRPIVTLRQGLGEAWFLFHAAGGSVFPYGALAGHLSDDRPMVGLQAPGLYGVKMPTTIEAMAELYLSDLLEHQARGPFFLAGWSLGGMIAIEVARRLSARGERVARLVLLDTARLSGLDHDALDQRQVFAEFAVDVAANLGLPTPDRDILFGPGDEAFRLARLRAWMAQHGSHQSKERMAGLLHTYWSCLRAGLSWAPAPYEGEALLIRATHKPKGWALAEDQGLRQFLPKLRITHVDADHYSLLRSPAIEKVAHHMVST